MITRTEPPIAVSVNRCQRIFRDAGYNAHVWLSHGPAGFMFVIDRVNPVLQGSVVVTQADIEGDEWVHASIAWFDTDPDYDELKTLHHAVFGPKRPAYQVFAPADEHVNIHEHALHLWGRADGTAVMPKFGIWGSI